MKVILTFDVVPEDGRGPIASADLIEHFRTYILDPNASYELSLIRDDPDHEAGGFDDYRTFHFIHGTVEESS